MAAAALDAPARRNTWKWAVCGLLLLATMINYMDRLTVNLTAKRIKDELSLTNEQYGDIEFAFGIAFALGAVVVGFLVDRWNVRWVYPAALLGWSAAGFVTGFAQTLAQLMLFRFALGLFEASNWPCALRTTQRILPPRERTMGNSILQSGGALGAIVTPLIVQALVDGPGTWRRPFFVVGAVGTVWVLFWLATVRSADLALPADPCPGTPGDATGPGPSFVDIFWDRRFWALVTLVVSINLTWHFFRVWLPLFLREARGYSESDVNYFTSAYYAAADAGCILSGLATLFLARRGFAVHTCRQLVFLAGSLLTMLSVAVAFLPAGPLLLGLLLLVAFGALGIFPPYYSFSQELTVRHQGKLTGTLGCTTWVVTALMHPLVGRWLDQTKNYSAVVALAGLCPLASFAVLVLLWRRQE
jgi:ACS family hexuronate transporter-like MFS transporter